MKQIITIVILLMLTGTSKGQEIVLYHSYIPTASSWDIVEWNLTDTTNHQWVLKETIDLNGRVVELEFLRNGNLITDFLCYLANRVTFEYTENKIIETLYRFDDELLATSCEMHYRNIYYLDDIGFITKTESLAKYDFSGMDKKRIEQWKEWVPEKVIRTDSNGINLQVRYYYHSYAKMNRIYPINRNYEWIDDYYYGDQPEKDSIKKGIEKLKSINSNSHD